MARTVLIVDDHASFRALASMLLESEGYEVVGEAEDGGGALGAAARLNPELVLLDIQLPDLDGFEVASRLSRNVDPPPVILISSRPASVYGPQIASSGALGFIRKDELSGVALDDALIDTRRE
jgi:CheY-like chemotaxis protein